MAFSSRNAWLNFNLKYGFKIACGYYRSYDKTTINNKNIEHRGHSKWKVLNEMAKSKAKKHKLNRPQLSNSWRDPFQQICYSFCHAFAVVKERDMLMMLQASTAPTMDWFVNRSSLWWTNSDRSMICFDLPPQSWSINLEKMLRLYVFILW